MKNNVTFLINPNNPALTYCADPSGVILSCSYLFANLVAKSHIEDVIDHYEDAFFTEDTLEIIEKNNQIAISQKTVQKFEEVWQLHNKKEKILCLCQRIALFNTKGECTAVIVSATDITAYKNQHASLQKDFGKIAREKEATDLYLKNIITNLPGHVYWENSDGTFLGCNDLQAISAGFEKSEDLIGKSLADISTNLGWSQAMLKEIRQNDINVMHSKQAVSAEEEAIWADGVPRTFLSKKSPLKDENDSCIGIIGISLDITEMRHLEKSLRMGKEQAESANIAKSNFIANISHDFRTPLHAMLGIAELLQIKRHFPEQDELIEGILYAGRSLLQLVEQILQYSELEAKKDNLQLETLNLCELIENLVFEHSIPAKEKGIDLIISYHEKTPRFIKSNRQCLTRIIGNLVGNAIKFTKHGHVLIAVETVKIDRNHATLQIVVEDTGMGIASKDLQYIFERFYRADSAHTGKYKGSGLGLAIAKQLSEYLNGTMDVNSQPGLGTTFRCSFPFSLANHSANRNAIEDQIIPAQVLIIDDHAKRREILLKQLSSKKKLALTSTKAVDLLTTRKKYPVHNIVIIDDDIKALAPNALAEIISSHQDEQGHNPLLVLARKNKENQVHDTTYNHFQFVLSKPIQPTEINHRLTFAWKRWLESQQRKHHSPIVQNLNVLLVEDEPLIQNFTRSILCEFGCNVKVAANGKSALLLTDENCFDLILMDIGLPDISGFEIAKEIRATNNKNRATQIVALTAHVSDDDKKHCSEAGIYNFLTKPASYSDFKALLTTMNNQQ